LGDRTGREAVRGISGLRERLDKLGLIGVELVL
jgi:hypothetical protein